MEFKASPANSNPTNPNALCINCGCIRLSHRLRGYTIKGEMLLCEKDSKALNQEEIEAIIKLDSERPEWYHEALSAGWKPPEAKQELPIELEEAVNWVCGSAGNAIARGNSKKWDAAVAVIKQALGIKSQVCKTCNDTRKVTCALCRGDWDNGRMSCMRCDHGEVECSTCSK